MSIHCISFADSSLHRSKERFVQQASSFLPFQYLHVTDESSLSNSFRLKHSSILNPNIRGYGFWIWKPSFILSYLNSIPLGDYVLYLDIGFHINCRGLSRFYSYLDALSSSSSDIVAFEYSRQIPTPLPQPCDTPDWRNKYFTKTSALKLFGYENNLEFLNRNVSAAGILLLKNSPNSRSFVREWLEIMESDYSLFDDSPQNNISNEFIVSRHDQSIFNLLLCKYNLTTLSGYEHWYPVKSRLGHFRADWKILESYPFHARRDKDYGLIAKITKAFQLSITHLL